MFSGEFWHLDSLANSHMPHTCTVGWKIFVDMKFLLYSRLDSYRKNIIHE